MALVLGAAYMLFAFVALKWVEKRARHAGTLALT